MVTFVSFASSIRPMTRLTLNPAVLISPTTEGYVAYDTAAERFHELNPMAALLVELCDGSRTTEDLESLAGPLLPTGSETAIREWVNLARQQGLLVEETQTEAAARERELTVPVLVELASRLRDEGKTQAAYLCQERASELQPLVSELLRELGELAHITGRRTAAREAYEKYLALEPEDAEVRHLLTSLRNDAPPDRVPSECIQQLYRRFSSFYEANMCEELSYEGPSRLREVIDESLGDRRGLSILDLGCGTGLSGLAVAERASRLVGVDLSPEMIEQARAREIYDELYVAEVATWLGENQEKFDLILACDTLIYFGDLRQVIAPAARHLESRWTHRLLRRKSRLGKFPPDGQRTLCPSSRPCSSDRRSLQLESGEPGRGLSSHGIWRPCHRIVCGVTASTGRRRSQRAAVIQGRLRPDAFIDLRLANAPLVQAGDGRKRAPVGRPRSLAVRGSIRLETSFWTTTHSQAR